jgi:hypothetical protein
VAVTAFPFNQSFKGLGLARFDFSSHTFKMMLTTGTYTPDRDTHEFKSAVTNEISGTGYTSGGVTLSGLSWTYDAGNDWCVLTCNPPAWSTATFTARRGVVYRDTGSAATSPLLSYVDFGADASPSASNFTITFTSGIYRVRATSA